MTALGLGQIQFRSLLGGLLSRLPFGLRLLAVLKKLLKLQPAKRPLDFGLNVLQQRLKDLDRESYSLDGKTVLEIAPGDNFSGPIAAVALGAAKGIGIDAYDYTDLTKNAEIVRCLDARKIAARDTLDTLSADLIDFSASRSSKYFAYFAPWRESDIAPGSVDLITSLSTLEHVQDPHALYAAAYGWLREDGLMIHKIDFSSHNMTKDWYGHLLLADPVFSLLSGKKESHLNRWTEDAHLTACKNTGFSLVKRIAFDGVKKAPAPYENLPSSVTHIWQKN